MLSALGVLPSQLVNLNGPGRYLEWGVLQVSWANAIVIIAMVAVFALALLLPFPKGEAEK